MTTDLKTGDLPVASHTRQGTRVNPQVACGFPCSGQAGDPMAGVQAWEAPSCLLFKAWTTRTTTIAAAIISAAPTTVIFIAVAPRERLLHTLPAGSGILSDSRQRCWSLSGLA